jgi:hypothetical protein
MGQIVGASVRFPTVTLTSALAVVLGFWLLVLLGRAGVRDFDADAPALTRSLGGLPVAVAASVVIVSAWLVSLAGTFLLDLARLTGAGDAAARVALFALSAFAAWATTRRCAARLARLFPGGAGAHRQTAAGSVPYHPGSPPVRG